MKRLLSIFLLLLAAASCRIPFELDQKGDPCLTIQAFVGGEHLIYVNADYAAPVNGGGLPGNLQGLNVQVFVNDESLGVEQLTEGVFSCSTQNILTPGDCVAVLVQADGLPQASGSVIIPKGPEIVGEEWNEFEISETDQDHKTGKRLIKQLRLTLDEAPGEDDFFGMQIFYNSKTSMADGSVRDTSGYSVPGYITSLSEIDQINLDDYIQVSFDGHYLGGKEYRPLTLLTSKHFQGNEYYCYLNSLDTGMISDLRSVWERAQNGERPSRPEESAGEMPAIPLDQIPLSVHSEYYVTVYRLSPEFYRYAMALYQSNFDFLSNMGFTPAKFSWSNVQGGLGFVGCAMLESVTSGEITIDYKTL